MWSTEIQNDSTPVGYRALVELFQIETLPHYRWSYVSKKWERKELHFEDQGISIYLYPPQLKQEFGPFQHIEFALKYEGINLLILKKVFQHIPIRDVEIYVLKHPTGKYARIVWFLYEKLLEKELSITNLTSGNYIPLLDIDHYYTSKPVHSIRHRVSDNLLGNLSFSPMVRKTKRLQYFEAKHLDKKALEVTKKHDRRTLERAMHYLSTKETLSSWEIEREKPDKTRLKRFIDLLEKAGTLKTLSESTLVGLQKEIVDPRFALNNYRSFQNYIGEEPSLDQLIIHYIPPKPEDVPALMNGLLNCFERMIHAEVSPVIAAAILSFGFVLIHPFWDGNGRLHRFLIHHALAKTGFAPKGFIFPVASAILREMKQYDSVLEVFSKPLLKLISNYTLDDAGEMHVQQETNEFYQYMDFTNVAEFVFDCVAKTIDHDLQQELQFLVSYDQAKQKLKEIVDIPDQSLDLFLRCVRQNGGSLSSRKRESHFSMLTNVEIARMEQVIASVYTN